MKEERDIYIITGDGREDDRHDILYCGDDEDDAIEVVINYLRTYNIGEDDFWKTDEKFEQDLIKYGKKSFVSNFNSAWLRSPNWLETKVTLK